MCSCMLLYIQLRAFFTCVGYVLCFAPVLMKMFRVAYIFRNPTHKKKVFVHRVIVIVVVVVVVVVLEAAVVVVVVVQGGKLTLLNCLVDISIIFIYLFICLFLCLFVYLFVCMLYFLGCQGLASVFAHFHFGRDHHSCRGAQLRCSHP